MNKKFYFGLALTAGLFASCSSDDVTTSEARQIAAIDDNAPAKVELNVGSIGATVETRGTGSVGVGANGATGYGWAGQTFNAFMLEKGTMKYAHTTYQDATTPFVFADDPTDATIKNGKGAEFTTPNQAGTPGMAAAGLTSNLEVYYPTGGVYDFWAYRLDDAYTTAAVEGYDDATADAIKIPFKIDGTQDIMVAKVTPSSEYDAAWADKLYSAYTGRRAVKAELDFKHQLTRLTFKVKAHSIEVSDAADPVPDLPTAAAGGYVGFKVTGISVRSNTTGKLVAASTDLDNWNPENAIEWDAATWNTPASLGELQLKSRAYGVDTEEDGTWFEVPTSAAIGNPISGASVATVIAADTKVYLTKDQHPTTKVPTGTSMTFSDWKASTPTASAWYWDQTQAYVPDYDAVDLNDNLQTLIPVQPHWAAAVTTYAWAKSDATAYAAAGTNVDQVATTETDEDDAIAAYTTAATAGDVGKVIMLYTENGTNSTYDDGTDTPVAYIIGTSSTTGGGAEATPVGEAIMAAPADANGYLVTVTYSYWKKLTATTSEEVTGATVAKQIVLMNKTGVQQPQPYKPGKQYNITIELFKNGTAESTTTVTDWDDDTENELDDSYEFE